MSALHQQLGLLKAKGQTALGPALMLAAGMAAENPCSRIILCTDGLSNIGVGGLATELAEQSSALSSFVADSATTLAFYARAGERMRSDGTSVSIVSFEGEHCNLQALGAVADLSGGAVYRAQPTELQLYMNEILQEPLLASNVSLRFYPHSRSVAKMFRWWEIFGLLQP